MSDQSEFEKALETAIENEAGPSYDGGDRAYTQCRNARINGMRWGCHWARDYFAKEIEELKDNFKRDRLKMAGLATERTKEIERLRAENEQLRRAPSLAVEVSKAAAMDAESKLTATEAHLNEMSVKALAYEAKLKLAVEALKIAIFWLNRYSIGRNSLTRQLEPLSEAQTAELDKWLKEIEQIEGEK